MEEAGEQRHLVSFASTVKTYQTLPDGPNGVVIGADRAKSITTWESIAFLTNTVIGPGLLMLPFMFEQGGIIPSLAGIIGFSFFAFFTTLAFARVVDDIQETTNERMEYVPLVRSLMGKAWGWCALVFLVLGQLAQLTASIIVTAQAMDKLFLLIFGSTVGLELSPKFEAVVFSKDDCAATGACQMFSASNIVLSFGYAAVCVAAIPYSMMNLSETMTLQLASYVITMIIIFIVIIDFLKGPLTPSSLPEIGSHQQYIVGIVIFNLMLAPYIPSWCHERRPNVKASTVVGGTVIGSAMQFIMLGVAGALRYPGIPGSVLHSMTSERAGIFMPLMADVFILLMVGTGIPEYAVIIRYCLEEVAGRTFATVVSLFSFVVCWLMYKEGYFLHILNWSGLVAGSVSSFLLPLIVCVYVRLISKPEDLAESKWSKPEGYLCVLMLLVIIPSVLYCIITNTTG